MRDFYPHFPKSNGKKWGQIGKLLLIKGVKSLCEISLFLGEFCLSAGFFFGIGVSHFPKTNVQTFFCFLESLGKSNEKKWYQI